MSGRMTVEQYERETPIRFSQAVAMLCIGRVSKQLRSNWRNRGIKIKGHPVYFEWFQQGNVIMTTAEAVSRWKAATNGGAR